MKSLSETKWTMSVDLSKLNRSAQDKKESSFLKKKTTAKNIIFLQLSEDCDVERNSCFPWHLTLPFYTIDSNFTSGFIWRQTCTPTTGGSVKFIITKLCKKRSNWQGKKHLITLSMLFSFNIQSSDKEFAWHYKRETTWSIFYNWNRASPCLKESDDRRNFYASWVTKPRKLWLH